MPEFRQDKATREWILITSERARSPHDFRVQRSPRDPTFMCSTPGAVCRSGESYHWHLQIMPCLTNPAGFELGSGMYINTALSEETAAFLRG